MKVSKKKIIGSVGFVLTFLSVSRVLILFLESLAVVRDERNADIELLDLCKTGSARGSIKMREACLKARADQASPVILKALMRAISVSYAGFVDQVSTRSGLLLFVLFVFSSLVLPIIPWIRTTIAFAQSFTRQTESRYEDDEDEEDVERRHSVVIMPGGNGPKSLRRRLARMINGHENRPKSGPIIELANQPISEWQNCDLRDDYNF